MKVGIYSPYLDTLGGGERYMLTFAEYCLQRDWDVEMFWKQDDQSIVTAAERFDLNLTGIKVNSSVYNLLQEDTSYAQKLLRWWKLRKYDLLFFLSDGSIPNLPAKENWLHFQVPFILNGETFLNEQKLTHVNRIICNSQFTRKFIEKSFKVSAEVIYPPVSVHDFHPSNISKENIILSVGRFDQVMNAKRQDVLIETFKKMVDDGLENWWLIFAGGVHPDREGELLALREMSMGYPIDFQVNLGYEELISWYHRASVYWHATGFEVDENVHPEETEHFGMSIVESMAAGCIPLVYPAGGVSEIITDKKNGYFWKSKEQLAQITKNIVQDLEKENNLVENAIQKSRDFSKERFFMDLEKRLG